MPETITRRNLLKLAGGSALGILFSPLPWKLLDDSAIWTQNWAMTPKLPRGPIGTRFSACTLCPGGCALKARCVGSVPFQLSGIPHHPISRGVLCPVGLSAHGLAFHPLRVSGPHKFTGKETESTLVPTTVEHVVGELASVLKRGETVAILDQRPGRAISEVYREFLSTGSSGIYAALPSSENATLSTLAGMCSTPGERFGFDFESTRCILSFGAPLLDGWGTPGRMITVLNRKTPCAPKLIQVESSQSRTALKADIWLPIRPGAESALALALGHVIVEERLFARTIEHNTTDFAAYKDLVSAFTPASVAEATGLTEGDIIRTAREFARRSPSIAIAGNDPASGPLGRAANVAIAGLNLLVNSVGVQGGVIRLPDSPCKNYTRPRGLHEIPDGSVQLLIIDAAESGEALPWSLVQRKLHPEKAVVVSLSPYLSGLSAHADYIIPAPAYLESLHDIPTPPGSAKSSLMLSSPLFPKAKDSIEPFEFIGKLAAAAGLKPLDDPETRMKQRVASIIEAKRGSVFSASDGATKEVAGFTTADELWEALVGGGCWIDGEGKQEKLPKLSLLGHPGDVRALKAALHAPQHKLVLMPVGWRVAIANGQLAPVMSKVFQESDLRALGGQAFINPLTAVTFGLVDGKLARLYTTRGSVDLPVHFEHGVVPGIVQVAVGPPPIGKMQTSSDEGVLSLCDVNDNGTWGLTEAKLEGLRS